MLEIHLFTKWWEYVVCFFYSHYFDRIPTMMLKTWGKIYVIEKCLDFRESLCISHYQNHRHWTVWLIRIAIHQHTHTKWDPLLQASKGGATRQFPALLNVRRQDHPNELDEETGVCWLLHPFKICFFYQTLIHIYKKYLMKNWHQ
jgi:hypothetical protein